jgi:transketolase
VALFADDAIEELLTLYGESELEQARRLIGSATLREAATLIVEAQAGLATIFIPHYWAEFYHDGTRMAGHVTHGGVPGVEVSTGALGHGLSIACGMALAGRRDRRRFRVFALLSDGECDEGATWEAALLAAHHRLDTLVAIIDYNKIQSLGAVKEVLDLEPLAQKWSAFGWAVREIDGHDVAEIRGALSEIPLTAGRPTCVVAHTVKGKGVSFMENELLWHYRAPDATETARALAELDAAP